MSVPRRIVIAMISGWKWENFCPSCGSSCIRPVAGQRGRGLPLEGDAGKRRLTCDAIVLDAIGGPGPPPTRSCDICGRQWASAEQTIRWRKFQKAWHAARDR